MTSHNQRLLIGTRDMCYILSKSQTIRLPIAWLLNYF